MRREGGGGGDLSFSPFCPERGIVPGLLARGVIIRGRKMARSTMATVAGMGEIEGMGSRSLCLRSAGDTINQSINLKVLLRVPPHRTVTNYGKLLLALIFGAELSSPKSKRGYHRC